MLLACLMLGLIAGTGVAAYHLRPSQFRRLSVNGRRGRITLFCVLLAVTIGVIAFWTWLLSPASDPLIGQTRADVIGTWAGQYSLDGMLHVYPNGTFTATGLPADADDAAGNGQSQPSTADGTWQVAGEGEVTFISSSGSTFDLNLGDPTSPGASTADFTSIYGQFRGMNVYFFVKV
jgi:hypothetical protein